MQSTSLSIHTKVKTLQEEQLAMLDSLASLDTTRTNWRVRVRVTRVWPTTAGGVVTMFNLILLDNADHHVHAFVRPETWDLLGQHIVEGGIYEISNFHTNQAIGFLRPVSSQIQVRFTNQTTVERILQDDLTIPINKFEFVHLEDLDSYVNSHVTDGPPRTTIDIIGVVQYRNEIRVIPTRNGNLQLLNLGLTDGRYSFQVNIFGDHVAAAEQLFQANQQIPIVAIFASVKVYQYMDIVKCITTQSTKIYFNIEHDSVPIMRERFANSIWEF